jgi:hypothetical protein
MLRRKWLIVYLVLFICASFFSVNLHASEELNTIDNNNVSIGAGLYYQKFIGTDDFRTGTGLFGDNDKINYLVGVSLNGELLLNKTFSIKSPLGFATGYRFQYASGGYVYSSYIGDTLERKVSLTNHIVYVSAALPLDNDKYFLLGVSVGAGLSKYTYSLKWTSRSAGNNDPNYNKSANGQVFPIGGFFDWGADGFGGRLGAEYIVSKYKKIDGSQPKANGMQYYLNIRYAI